jgi:subtilisin family serine protease
VAGFKSSNPGCCCEPPYDLCIYVCLCGELRAGLTVTITGPDSFSDTCETDANGRCCIEVTDPGTYSASVVYESTTYTGTTVLPAGGPAATIWIKALLAHITLAEPCGGAPMPGIDATFTQGATVVSATSDASGVIEVCLPTGGVWSFQLVDPPCPYAAFSTAYDLAAMFNQCSVTRSYVVPYQAGYRCACGLDFPVPSSGYTVAIPCNASPSLPLFYGTGTPGYTCVDITSDVICRVVTVECPYGGTSYELQRQSGNTSIGLILACDDEGWYLDVTWGAQIMPEPCSDLVPFEDLVWDTAIAGETDWPEGPDDPGGVDPIDPGGDPYTPICPWEWCWVGASLYYYRTMVVRVPLTGTVEAGNVLLTGTIPASVLLTDAYFLYPVDVVVPCSGTVTVSRTWCDE